MLKLNTVQFNGVYGCSKCLQPRAIFQTSSCGHVHIYPNSAEDPTGPKRSNEQLILNATKALQEQTIVKGVKGPSWLRKLTMIS